MKSTYIALEKILALLLLTVTLCAICTACQVEPEPELPIADEPEPTDEQSDTRWHVLTPEEQATLEAFRNEPKEPWGENDISIYRYDGTILETPLEIPTDEIGLTASASLIRHSMSTTYRGICLGDDALESLKRMNLPEGTIYIDKSQSFDGGYGFPVRYEPEQLETIVARHRDRLLIFVIFLDADFHVVTETCSYIERYEQPGSLPENASIVISFTFLNGLVDSYSAGYLQDQGPIPEQPH